MRPDRRVARQPHPLARQFDLDLAGALALAPRNIGYHIVHHVHPQVSLTALDHDLTRVRRTPNLVYITPDLCHDGHDSPCVDGSPGGMGTADKWLSEQVPAILASPAFRQDGMLVITFDEADGGAEGPAGVVGGTAGGKVGTLVISPFTAPGATSDRQYNHYSLLASMENFFSLSRLAGAGEPGVNTFGADVYRAGS